jgi:hypothetical protein
MTELTPDEAQKIAAEAFAFGYPLVLMDLTSCGYDKRLRAEAGRTPIDGTWAPPEIRKRADRP